MHSGGAVVYEGGRRAAVVWPDAISDADAMATGNRALYGVAKASLPTSLKATLLGPVWSGEELGNRAGLSVQVEDRYGNDVAGIDSLKYLLIGFSNNHRKQVKFIQGGKAFIQPSTGKVNITAMEIEAMNDGSPFTTILNITSDEFLNPDDDLFGQLEITFETCQSGWVPPSTSFGNCVRCAPGERLFVPPALGAS